MNYQEIREQIDDFEHEDGRGCFVYTILGLILGIILLICIVLMFN